MPEKEILINSVYHIELMAISLRKEYVSQFKHPGHKLCVTLSYPKYSLNHSPTSLPSAYKFQGVGRWQT